MEAKAMFDMHVHLPGKPLRDALGNDVYEASVRYFRANVVEREFDEVEEDLRSQGVSSYALLPVPYVNMDARAVNVRTARLASKSSSAHGYACVNPGTEVESTIREALDMGLRGLKLHPNLQSVYPTDPRLRPAYKALSDAGACVVVHTGTSGIGGGMKGGGGFKLDFSRPIHVDSVAADYPQLNFVMAHFGWPWTTEAIAVALQKGNVYLDLSGWSPKYIPPEVWTYANTLLKAKIVYGSDYPFVQPSRWRREFESIQLKDDVKQAILEGNAQALHKQ